MERLGIRERILSNEWVKRVFLYTFICGILAHGSVMTKALFWHDGLALAYKLSVSSAVRMGRWMRALLGWIVSVMFGGTNPSLPLLYGVVSVFFIAASTCVIIRLYRIEKKIYQMILCGMLVAFPAVTSSFAFMYTAPYYYFGLFLSTLAALAAREKGGLSGFLIGAVCLSCALGIYQIYISVTVSIFVIALVVDIATDRFTTVPDFLKKAFYCLGVSIAGFVLYFVIWKVCLRVMSLTASNYQGISSVGSRSIGDYLGSVKQAYSKFFLLNQNARDNLYPMGLKTAQIIIIALSGVFSVIMVIRQFKKSVLLGVAMALLIVMLPLCFNLVYVFGSERVHTVMLYGQCMLYVYLVCAMAYSFRDKTMPGVGLVRLSTAALAIMVAMNVFFDNGCYLRAEMQLQQSISNMTALVSRIKSTDGYDDEMPVCITFEGHMDATITQDEDLSEFNVTPWNRLMPYKGVTQKYCTTYLLKRWCGFSPKYVTYKKFGHKKIVEKMPYYPDAGSVQIVDGTVVVRM